jgi:hypothetical protein
MNPKKIIYSINIGDIQNVANDELGRDLTSEEIKLIEPAIGDKIKWYDIIEEAINQNIKAVSKY